MNCQLLALALLTSPCLAQATLTNIGMVPGVVGSPNILAMDATGETVCGQAGTAAFIWHEATGFTVLPVPPGPYSQVTITSISGDGLVVGGRLEAPAFGSPFRWRQSVGYEILDLPPGHAGASASGVVTALSFDGTVAGGSTIASFFGSSVAVIWDVAGMPSVIPNAQSSNQASVSSISAAGDAVTGVEWQPSPMTGSQATGFLNLGPQGTIALERPAAASFGAFAEALSADGSIVFGSAASAPGVDFPWLLRWDRLGRLEVTDFGSAVTSIQAVTGADARGESAVGSTFLSSSFYWSEGTGVMTAAELFVELGLPASSLINRFTAISDSGNVIAGSSAQSGGGYLLRLAPDDPQGVGQTECAAAPNSTGSPSELEAYGSSFLAQRSLTLRVDGLPEQSFGIFVASLTPDVVPGFGGGQGTLCLGGTLGNFTGPGAIRNSSIFGRVALRLDLDSIPQLNSTIPALPGSKWYFQFWHRDRVGGAATSNLSTAQSVTFQ